MDGKKTVRTRYVIILEPVADCREPEALRGLRWLLKRALRQYGLRCVSCRPDASQAAEVAEGSDGA